MPVTLSMLIILVALLYIVKLDKLDIAPVLFILYNKEPVSLNIRIGFVDDVLFCITNELLFNDALQTAMPFIVVPFAFTDNYC